MAEPVDTVLIRVKPAETADEALDRVAEVAMALSAAHGFALRQVIVAEDERGRSQAIEMQRTVFEALGKLGSVELYLRARRKAGRPGGQ